MRYSSLIILIIFLSVSALSACASNELEDHDASDVQLDVHTDATQSEDVVDAKDAVEEVEAPPFCTPSDNGCADENTTRICAPDGSEFIEEACQDDEECENAACVVPPDCEPGTRQCGDATTLWICRPNSKWRSEACHEGESCVDDTCISGVPNGQPCQAHDDCAKGICRCGAEESCDPVGGVAVEPYCTETCTPGSCGSGEVCLSSTDFPAGGQDHCVQTCNQTCALDGMTCASIPTRDSGSLTFEPACVPEGVIDIGQECDASSADACTGGICLEDYLAADFCTSECSGDCPEGTACVKLKTDNDAYRCIPTCKANVCPLAGWGVSCKSDRDFNDDDVSVCYKSNNNG